DGAAGLPVHASGAIGPPLPFPDVRFAAAAFSTPPPPADGGFLRPRTRPTQKPIEHSPLRAQVRLPPLRITTRPPFILQRFDLRRGQMPGQRPWPPIRSRLELDRLDLHPAAQSLVPRALEVVEIDPIARR